MDGALKKGLGGRRQEIETHANRLIASFAATGMASPPLMA
jgi:hypothetical protein